MRIFLDFQPKSKKFSEIALASSKGISSKDPIKTTQLTVESALFGLTPTFTGNARSVSEIYKNRSLKYNKK